jgi:uncharacterized protein with von Willebrand factor type A (vWA) domain
MTAASWRWALVSIVARKPRLVQNLQYFFDLIFGDSQLNVYGGELEVRPPRAPTTAGRSGKGVLVRARSKQNRCLEESGVIRRVEEAGMMGQNRLDSYKARQFQPVDFTGLESGSEIGNRTQPRCHRLHCRCAVSVRRSASFLKGFQLMPAGLLFEGGDEGAHVDCLQQTPTA